ncbi:hypothetical protein JGH11_01760 [Dysgonomonas sp. Marseille-P4677]|uniref:hypothetical protein n=1 Tax=Dysgonomonas sp. Marseille-P4677 TaxID=2364790 RepID=UPI0019140D1F|nr:hypothetical protein [Dysgonomonas sp. Marseille-P4677]MBK5719589.1 hypothetical protein [Dysgonomonas sp. Marseille-P4677]
MIQKEIKKKLCFFRTTSFVIIFYFFVTTIDAQITIGSNIPPGKAAILDLKELSTSENEITASKGLLLPRVGLLNIHSLAPLVSTDEEDYETLKISHKGLVVYNINVQENQNLTQGVYTWNGSKWKKSAGYRDTRDFFYMPSIPINTTEPGTKTLDLYTLYKNQFSSPKSISEGAPASIPFYANATDLYYYVTDYDATVFSNVSISANGIMTYTIINAASSYSYINIVFLIK